jgi:multidrug efflux pump subunit AcrA (membrane-fusion protein)
MGFRPALAATKVTLAATSYIRFASKIERQQSIDIASLQSGRLLKQKISEDMQVKQGQALVKV